MTAALYCWCWTANPWSKCAFLAGFTNIRKELSYHTGVSLPSSASRTWVNYITLFASELTILFISWRKTNFTSVLLCAQISCFLDFTPLILPTNKRFLLSFHFQLNLHCSLYYFALLRKTSKFPVSAQLAGLLRLFLKHRKLLCCLFCSAAEFMTTVPSLRCLHNSLEPDLHGNCHKTSETHHLTQITSQKGRSKIAKLSSPRQPEHL